MWGGSLQVGRRPSGLGRRLVLQSGPRPHPGHQKCTCADVHVDDCGEVGVGKKGSTVGPVAEGTAGV